MGQVHSSDDTVSALPLLGEELVGTARPAVHIRRIHHKEDTLAVVARVGQRRHALHHVVGRRLGVRPRSRIFHQSVLLPELRHSLVVAREVATDGRLSVRVEGELRSAQAADSPHHASDTAHAARIRMPVVHQLATVGL